MIIWIASYPKSGNTWCRAFIANLLDGGDAPVNINDLHTIPSAASRELIDAALGISSSDLTTDETHRLRPRVYEHLASESPNGRFIKIHDALPVRGDSVSVVPANATAGAVYVVRNPLDVAVSLAHHEGRSIDAIIDDMGNEQHTVGGSPEQYSPLVPQHVRSWSSHVESWLDSPLKTSVIRYENALVQPLEIFSRVARFCGLPDDHDRVRKAVEFSSFDELKGQEHEHGFAERSQRSNSFFRQGNAGGWKDVLTTAHVDRIIRDHGRVMERVGYSI